MLRTPKVLLILCSALCLAQMVGAQFRTEHPEYGNLARGNYIDVYYEYTPPPAGESGLSQLNSRVERGFWNIAESARKRLVCESGRYRMVASIEKPAIREMSVGGVNLLGEEGIYIQVEDHLGNQYRSDLSPVKARQNTWRAGYDYYDARLLEFRLASPRGDTLPLAGEIILHAYPDKIHVEARLNLVEGLDLRQATLACHLGDRLEKAGSGWMVAGEEYALGILGGEAGKKRIAVPLKGENKPGGSLEGYLAFFPGKGREPVLQALEQAANPLPAGALRIRDGIFLGYNAAAGFYEISNIHGLSASNFTSFYLNPNMYLSTGLEINNDDRERQIYIRHSAGAGAIEAAILTDSTGFPLPVPVQCAKNFGGEKEEPDDSPFYESYFLLSLAPSERKVLNVLHLHQNWGDHPLRQLSSIRFFQIYYHLSQGVTETTCFSLPTKFGSIPSGEPRAYTLADYRPLSGQTWHGSPQHHHVALQGWLQYRDAGGNWRYPVYQGSEIYSAGPNLAWFTMRYISSDGKVDQQLEIFEMPQQDESRTHIRFRYLFREDVVIEGDVCRNLRLLNAGSYIRRVNWKELAWTGEDGEIHRHPIHNDGKWAITGEALKPYNAFCCAYPHTDGNNGLVLRRVSGEVNGSFFNRIGFSAIAHEDGKTELMLVPLIDGNIIRAGSMIELDCILIPYGNEYSNWGIPYQESIRFGLNQEELEQYRELAGLPEGDEPVFGPRLEVLHGEKVMDLPPVLRVKDNYATARFSGGHDRTALVANGFSHPKYPLLWDGEAFLDPQVRGHDGIQSLQLRDGSYGFIFTPRARTTRVSGEWGSIPHTYHITQAISVPGISRISSENGRVRIVQFSPGRIDLVSPRIWYPARNQMLNGHLNKTTSETTVIRTVPLRLTGEDRPGMIEISGYSPDRIHLKAVSDRPFGLEVRGLYQGRPYAVDQDGIVSEVGTDKNGVMQLVVEGKGTITEINIQLQE